MRNPKKVIYASSADRGLDTLLKIWPDVIKEVPDAELVWAYGWNVFDEFHRKNPAKMKWKWQVIKDMHNNNVKALGRLSHEELAKEMKTCGVWAYPTEFPEIFCITATKAQMAGLHPVTSGYAALQEVIHPDYRSESIEDINLKPEELERFTKRLIKALKNPITDKERNKLKEFASQYDWSSVAEHWGKTCDLGV